MTAPLILGIDTSACQCAVALVAGEAVWRHAETMERGHAERLFPLIEAVLAEAGAEWKDLTRIAVCTGPGSFTGVRIGVAAARGLALGLGVPAVGITRLEALAAGAEGRLTVRVPGRGGQVHVQNFQDGMPHGPPRIETGEAEDPLADPTVIARLAVGREAGARPAPLYLRGADAAPPRDGPPAVLD